MARWAVFDVDGTLIPGTSLEKEFVLFLLHHHIINPLQLLFFLTKFIVDLPRAGLIPAMKANKAFFAGLDVEKIHRAADVFFRHSLQNLLSDKGIAEIQKRRARGYRIMVLSGAPLFLLHHVNRFIHADQIVGSVLQQQKRKFTGRLDGQHFYGASKRELLEQLRTRLDIDFSRSVVFANHTSDEYHMTLFGEAVAVNPDRMLLKVARQKGWKIAYWQ